MLAAAAELPKDEFSDIPTWQRRLALVYACIGNDVRAGELLNEAEMQLTEKYGGYPDDAAREFFEAAMARAKSSLLRGKNQEALIHLQRAKAWARKIDADGLMDFAGKIDDSGLVAGFLAFAAEREFSQIVKEQLAAGGTYAAIETWMEMPLCLQKLYAQIEMAKFFRDKRQPDAANECVKRCQAMRRAVNSAQDAAVVALALAVIYREIGSERKAQDTISRLIVSPNIQSSTDAIQFVASELVEMGLLNDAYRMLNTMDSQADRAVILARICSETSQRSRKSVE